ncbi:MAG TPA: hypothetical protein VK759_02040 [Rhizomicrobium sp.]|nr:hypothetical protein [Rhizomicrobium sp.]
MAVQRSFGRKAARPAAPARVAAEAPPSSARVASPEISVERHLPHQAQPEPPSLDEELREWKRSRKHGFEIPWRPLYIVASACFGVASFILPDSVNGNADYLLYALMGLSLYAGFRKRRRKAES